MSLFLGRASRLTGPRLVAVLAGCVAVAALVTFLAPLIGVEMGPHGRSIELLSPGALRDDGSVEHTILLYGRLPRVLGAMLVGAALAAAGCTFQAVLRNPLAEPYTLGISGGSSLAAVIAIRIGFEGALGGSGVGVAAVMGAIAAVGAVWLLGRVGSSLPPATLLLAGVTVAMWCSSASMMVQATADFTETSRMVHWMMGDLEAVRWASLSRSGVAIGVGLAVLLSLSRDLNALAAGHEAAAAVGVAVGRSQTLAFVASSLLVGAAISISGPIGFIGLMVPHGMRALIGPDHRALLPASILGGGAALVVCDTLARTVIAPHHLPVGVVTAFFGGPVLLALLVRAKRSAGLWGRA
jgi:iron complex transport system permease protein